MLFWVLRRSVDVVGDAQLVIELHRLGDVQRALTAAVILAFAAALDIQAAAGAGDVHGCGNIAAAVHAVRLHDVQAAVVGAIGVDRAAVNVATADRVDAGGALHVEAAAVEHAGAGAAVIALGTEIALHALGAHHVEAAAAARAEIAAAHLGHGDGADRAGVLYLHLRQVEIAIQPVLAGAPGERFSPRIGLRHACGFRGVRKDRHAGRGQRGGQEHQAFKRHVGTPVPFGA